VGTVVLCAAAVFLGAVAWALIWKERSDKVLGVISSLLLTAAAGLLTDNLSAGLYWVFMFIAMYIGGVLLHALVIF